VLNLVVFSILHASRVGQVNRCLIEAKELQAELKALLARFTWSSANMIETAADSRVAHKAET